MNSSNLDIYVRAYAKPKSSSVAKQDSNADDPPAFTSAQPQPYTRPRRILVLDTETTNDEKQTLKFGYFEIYQDSQLDFCGLFYNENFIHEKELGILNEYCNVRNIPVMTRKQFNDEVFYAEVFFKQTCCVGFNLPFDISRIALDVGYARDKTMLGGFSFKLSTNMEYPRVLIKHINNTMSFIKFSRSIIRYTNGFKGNFVDLRTLGWAIRNKKFSLESACKEFNTETQKKRASQHGKITPDYIDYCINDVKATYSLFGAMLKEYEKYGINLEPSKAFSPASIGKALLHKMGVAESSQKISQIPDTLLGYVMSAYYGGRSEVRIRKTPVPVVYMDFLSMYPTVCILMDLWKLITCDHVEYVDCTAEIADLIDGITLEKLTDKALWKELAVIVEVEPHGDILPVRAKYDGQTHGIGINHLEGNGRRLWYTIHDVIVSKLLTGKTPKITNAIKFVPVGLQNNLKPIEFLGRQIDPSKDDFFKALIEYRKEIQARAKTLPPDSNEQAELQSNQYITKIIANATSYGIFIELNESEEESEIEVFGIDSFSTLKTKVEKTGSMFNPILAVLITGASRLMLGMAETFVSQKSGYIAFCDTDSIAVNSELAQDLQIFFQPLNPYGFGGDILKIEDDNYRLTRNGKADYSIDPIQNPLLFFGISAKRYVLYRKQGSAIITIKNTEHGLGGFLDPFGREHADWIPRFWQHAMTDYYQNSAITRNVLYSQLLVASKQVISTKSVLERFDKLNIAKNYDDSIKPFNFFIVGAGNRPDRQTGQAIIPLVPFSKNVRKVIQQPFIDYKSGRKYPVGHQRYWKTLDEIYSGYFNHRESKFEGTVGHLQRKFVSINNIIHIGKETSSLELDYMLGLCNLNGDIIEEYSNINSTYNKLNVSKSNFTTYFRSNLVTFKLRKRSKLRKLVDKQFTEIQGWILQLSKINLLQFGISKKVLYRVKRSIKQGNGDKLSKNTKLKFINCHNKMARMATSGENVANYVPLNMKEVIIV